MTPQMTIREMALGKFRVTSSTTAQGTITVPAPTMGIKSSTASPKASSRPYGCRVRTKPPSRMKNTPTDSSSSAFK